MGSVDVATRPWAGRTKNQGSISGRTKRFSSLHKAPRDSGAHALSYTKDTGSNRRSVKLSTHLHLVSRLRMVTSIIPYVLRAGASLSSGILMFFVPTYITD